jgi:ribbon-helix-helix CopG family protein
VPAPRPVSFRLDEELMAWVRKTADRQGTTLSAVVEGALRDARQTRGFKAARHPF